MSIPNRRRNVLTVPVSSSRDFAFDVPYGARVHRGEYDDVLPYGAKVPQPDLVVPMMPATHSVNFLASVRQNNLAAAAAKEAYLKSTPVANNPYAIAARRGAIAEQEARMGSMAGVPMMPMIVGGGAVVGSGGAVSMSAGGVARSADANGGNGERVRTAPTDERGRAIEI